MTGFESGLEKIKHKIKARLVNDKFFAAKVLFAMDDRLQLHMEECRMADDRSEVDETVLNFDDIIRDIKHNRFFIDLPPSFKEISSEDAPESKDKKKDKEKTEARGQL